MRFLFRRLFGPDDGAGAGAGSGGTTNREGAAAAAAGTGAAAGGAANGEAGAAAAAAAAAASAGAAGAAAGGDAAAAAAAAAAGAGAGAGAGADDPAARWNTARTGWARGDAAKLNWANRYASDQAMLDAAWAAQDRIAKGDLSRPLPENATPEQLADYRKAHGIPAKADGYWDAVKDVKLEDGDKEILAPYLPIMHELNLTPAQASKLINFRQAEQERQVDERIQADNTLRKTTEDALHQEWGSQYRQNVEAMRGFIETRFGDATEDLMNARTPNGDPLLGSPTVLRALMQMAMDLNGGVPTITLADGKLADGAGVDGRMKEIEEMMRKDNAAYVRNEAVQKEYRQLIEYKERNAARR